MNTTSAPRGLQPLTSGKKALGLLIVIVLVFFVIVVLLMNHDTDKSGSTVQNTAHAQSSAVFPVCADNEIEHDDGEIRLWGYADCKTEMIKLPGSWFVTMPDPENPGRFIPKYRYFIDAGDKALEVRYQDGHISKLGGQDHGWYEGYPVFSLRAPDGKTRIIIRKLENKNFVVYHEETN